MKAVVELIGEYESFKRMVTGTVAGSSTMKREFSELSLSASKSAEAQVKSSALRISRMRAEIVEVQALSSAYKRGSDEQIAAMTLVARKQAELNRLTGSSVLAAGGRGRGGSNLRRDEREASGLSRGLLAGGGVGHVGLAALSGGAFFGSFVAASAGRATIDAATESLATEKQLAAQYRASGQALGAYRKQIDETLDRESLLSGFNKDELTKSYTTIFRAAGDTGKALKDEAIAADVARGRHIDLSVASLLVAKVINGNIGILKRYGIETYKGETATEALAAVQQKYAGQAAAGATAQQKFAAELHNSEVIIGTALLPTVTHLLTEGAHWLDQMNRSGRLQRDVNTAVHDGAVVIHDLQSGAHLLIGTIQTVDHVTGSFKDTLLILAGIKLVSELNGWAGGFTAAGREAKAARGEVSLLSAELGGLPAVIPITIAVGITYEAFKHKGQIEGAINRGLGALGLPGIGGANLTKSDKAADAQSLKTINRLLGTTDPNDQASLDLLYKWRKQITGQGAPQATTGLGPHHAPPPRPRDTTTTPKGPIHEFALTSFLTNRLASAITPKEDKLAAEAALSYTQKLLNTGRLVGAAYTDALKERKRLYAEIAADNRKLNPRGSSSTNPLPLGEQGALANAEAAAATKKLPQLRALAAEEKHALDILNGQHATGKALVELDKKRAALSKELAATNAKIASIQDAAAKKQADAAKKLADAFKANLQTAFGVLGELGQGPVATGPAAQFAQQYGGTLSAKGYLADITQQNKAGRAELTNLNTLRRRGAPEGLITNILGQGTAGQGIANALAHATPAVLRAFLGQYKERQQTAIQLAKMQVATMHVDKLVTGPAKSDARDRPSTTNKFGRVPTAGRRR